MRIIGLNLARGVDGVSGGDVVFDNNWHRFDCEKTLIKPKDKKQPKSFALAYFIRTLLNLWLPKGDVVYSSSDFLPDVLPAYLSRKKWVQKIYHIIPRQGLSRKMQELSFWLIKKRCDLIITSSKLVKLQLRDLGFQNRIEVVYPGVPEAERVEPYPQYDIVFIGARQSKGVDDLIKISDHLTRMGVFHNIAVIGKGKFGILKRISFLGYLPEKQKKRVLSSAKIFVSTSREEGFGLAICEAMSYGLPVYVWDLPIYDEIFGDYVCKIPIGDIEQFARNLRFALNPDVNYRFNKDFSRKFIRRYDLDKSAKEEMELICTL